MSSLVSLKYIDVCVWGRLQQGLYIGEMCCLGIVYKVLGFRFMGLFYKVGFVFLRVQFQMFFDRDYIIVVFFFFTAVLIFCCVSFRSIEFGVFQIEEKAVGIGVYFVFEFCVGSESGVLFYDSFEFIFGVRLVQVWIVGMRVRAVRL